MGLKIGCDIVYIPRFKKLIEKRPRLLEKIFTPLELKNKSAEHLAGIFAAKEAAIKALGLKPKSWHQIEVKKERDGTPKIKKLCLSISHDGDYALAVVIAIGK